MAKQEETTSVLATWLRRSEAGSSAEPNAPLHKRQYQRYAGVDDFIIKPAESHDFPECYVRSFNISAGGLCVICRHHIPELDSVLIHSDATGEEEPWVTGVVVHCTQTLGGYKVGMQFTMQEEDQEEPASDEDLEAPARESSQGEPTSEPA